MKLVYLADGRSIHTQRWVRYFVKQRHEVHLLTFDPVNIKGAVVHTMPRRGSAFLTFLSAILQVRWLLKKIRPDILHAHYVYGYGWLGALAGFHPFILSPWGSDIALSPQYPHLWRWLTQFTIRKADKVSAVNPPLIQQLIKLGCAKKQLLPLRISSVDTSRFNPNAASKAFRRSLAKDNEPIILSARYLKPEYHVDVIIRAMPLILERVKSAKLVILGNGPLSHELKALAATLGIEEHTLFLGNIKHNLMPKYMASADVLVDTFIREIGQEADDEYSGIGTTTLEAMSCGTPVYISHNRNTKHLYRTYLPGNPRSLAKVLIKLLTSTRSQTKLKNDLREFVVSSASEGAVMGKWGEEYMRIQKTNSLIHPTRHKPHD